jgi:hypothetical protein
LIAASSKAGCHAVLASLSGRYPPLEGRSPTCYSPVCHSTNPLRDFRVRLACVRHAASVDSEPGSNSHVKFAVAPWRTLAGPRRRSNSINARPIYWLCVVQSVVICSGSSPVAFARTDHSSRPLDAMPPADSHCLSRHCPRGSRPEHTARIDGLCVLARTIQFSKNRPSVRPGRPAPLRPNRLRRRPRLGEPSKVTRTF